MYFTKEHEWVELDGDNAIVGITEYAVEQLGDITFVELPEVGEETTQNEVFCSIESVKAASDIYAPISGEIVEVNEELEDEPEIVNEDPIKKGWIAKISLKDKSELDSLLSKEQYDEYIKGL